MAGCTSQVSAWNCQEINSPIIVHWCVSSGKFYDSTMNEMEVFQLRNFVDESLKECEGKAKCVTCHGFISEALIEGCVLGVVTDVVCPVYV